MGVFNCTVPLKQACSGAAPTQIAGNASIAGPGTIYSFIVSAWLTLILCTLGTITNIIIRHRYGREAFKGAPPRGSQLARWKFTFEKVISDLSAQQWILGIAILLTAVIQQCELAVYHWTLITYLAVLSAVTQTATFVVLSAQFRKYFWVRLIRLAGITSMMALLTYGVAVECKTPGWDFDSGGNARWPARCFLYGGGTTPATTSEPKPKMLLAVMFSLVWIAFVATLPALSKRSLKGMETRGIDTAYYVIRGVLTVGVPWVVVMWTTKNMIQDRSSFHRGGWLSDNTESHWSFAQFLTVLMLASLGRIIVENITKEHFDREVFVRQERLSGLHDGYEQYRM